MNKKHEITEAVIKTETKHKTNYRRAYRDRTVFFFIKPTLDIDVMDIATMFALLINSPSSSTVIPHIRAKEIRYTNYVR